MSIKLLELNAGGQYYDNKSAALRARAVRRVIVDYRL